MDIRGRRQRRSGDDLARAEPDEPYVVDHETRPASRSRLGNNETNPPATAMTTSRVIWLAGLAGLAAEFAAAGLWSVRLAAADYWFTKEKPQGAGEALGLTQIRKSGCTV